MVSNARKLAALSTLVLCNALREPTSSEASKTYEVHAYWIRHGLSCANVLKMQALDERMSWRVKAQSRLQFPAYSDPPLTNCAIGRAKGTGPNILDQIKKDHPGWVDRMVHMNWPILVFSSQMLRAIETALYNFEGMPVYPIPHIAEHGPGLDNQPKAWNVSRALKIGDPEDRLKNIAFRQGVNDPFTGSAMEFYFKSDYGAFKQSFPGILRAILADNGVNIEQINSSLPIPIAIVSHSSFMANELACQKDKKPRRKPANNQAWMQVYHVTDDEMEEAGCTEDVLPEEKYGEAPKLMCAGMVERCRKGFTPDYLIEADEAKCCSAGWEGSCSD